MSDVMLIGALRMPPNLWSGTELDVSQRYSRYIQAADRIESDAEEIAGLKQRIKDLETQLELSEARVGRLEYGIHIINNVFADNKNIQELRAQMFKLAEIYIETPQQSLAAIKADAVMEFVKHMDNEGPWQYREDAVRYIDTLRKDTDQEVK